MHLSSPLVFDDIFCNAESTSLLVFDRKGIIEDINLGFEKLSGYSLDALLGKHISVLYTPTDIALGVPEGVINRAVQAGTSYNDSYIILHNGSQIWVHAECVLVKDQAGEEHLVKIIHNLHNEKQLEEQLREKNREQEKIILDHDTFVYTTSHDLRSPLNNLDALVNNLGENADDPDMIAELIPLINDSITRLRNKINELSVIGKRREEENQSASVIFQDVYEDVLKDLEIEITTSKAVLTADFTHLPSIRFAKKDIRSLLQNFVSNALKYRHPERQPFIHVATSPVDPSLVLLTVEDNGLGIKQEHKERIFDMYARFHHQVDGTGVGLGIVKKIVNNNGGRIEVESELGQGSTFKVFLKVQEPTTTGQANTARLNTL